jgi:hypothetical protein
MATFGELKRKEALAANGRPVIWQAKAWRFILSFGIAKDIPTREDFDEIPAFNRGYLLGRFGLPTNATYETFVERAKIAIAHEIASGYENAWVFSGQLHPLGRSSTKEDWNYLGEVAASVGAPEIPTTPIETTHPNAPHYWIWKETLAS